MTPDDTPPLFIAHDIDDLFNAVPTFLGFRPAESIVAIATEGPRRRFGFRMRIDMPVKAGDIEGIAETVLHHLRANGADGAIVLALTEHQDMAREALMAIESGLGDIEPIVISRSDGHRYWVDVPGFPAEGVGYETSDHHVSIVSAVAAGQEILSSREALAERVAGPTGERLIDLAAVYADQWPRVLGQLGKDPDDVLAVAMDDLALVLKRIDSDAPLDDEQTAQLCIWATVAEVREALWQRIDESSAQRWLPVLCQCSRDALDLFAPSVLALTGYAAWMVGNGALSSMALERALLIDPDHRVCLLMMQLLQQGVAPPSWQRRRAG